MASHFQSARHVAARNTILLWLGGVIVIAGIGVLVTYHALRDHSMQLSQSVPLLSQPNATTPAPALRKVPKTDSAADVVRAHNSAVATATGADAKADAAPVTAPATKKP